MTTDPEFTEIFISHASEDVARAALIAKLLTSSLKIPKDEVVCTSNIEHALAPGATFEKGIRQAIKSCSLVVLLVSPASLASFFCVVEFGAAWGARKRIFPVALPETDIGAIERPLSSLQILPWSEPRTWIKLLNMAKEESAAGKRSPSKWKETANAIAASAA